MSGESIISLSVRYVIFRTSSIMIDEQAQKKYISRFRRSSTFMFCVPAASNILETWSHVVIGSQSTVVQVPVVSSTMVS